MPARFRPRQRLRTRAEFDRVFRRGVRVEGGLFTLIGAPNGGSVDRLGLVVSRRFGGAVARNRARRLLRESFRRLSRGERAGLDLVVLAKASLGGRRLGEVDDELQRRVAELARGATARRTRPHPPG